MLVVIQGSSTLTQSRPAVSVYLRVARTHVRDEYTAAWHFDSHTLATYQRAQRCDVTPGIHRRRRRVWQVGLWPSTNRSNHVPSLQYFPLDFSRSPSLFFFVLSLFHASSLRPELRCRIKDIARTHQPGLLEYWVTLDGVGKFLGQNERRDTRSCKLNFANATDEVLEIRFV